MFKRQVSSFVNLSIMLIGIFAFSSSINVEAQSSGCTALNAGSPTIRSGGPRVYIVEYQMRDIFEAGDTVNWSISSDSTYIVTIANDDLSQIIINETGFRGGSSSGSLTIPSTGSHTVWLLYTSRTSFQPISATCTPAPVAPVAPIPVDDTVYPPDDRINWQYGDLNVVVYDHEEGVVAYCYNGNTWLGMHVTQAIVDNATLTQAQNIPVLEYNENGCHIAFYILDSGEYQINIWTFEGKLYEFVFDNLDFENATMRYFDPNE